LSEIANAVESYRMAGLIPFPVCKPSLRGGCVQHGPGCRHPGKTPLLGGWNRLVPGDDHIVDSVFEQHGWDTNIGIRTGQAAGLYVLDLDGGDAPGPVGNPLKVATGRVGGWHLWYKPNGTAIPTKIGATNGLDFMGEDGYVLAPPSLHASGRQYTWKADGAFDLDSRPDVPGWVLDLPSVRAKAEAASLPDAEDGEVRIGRAAREFLENGAEESQRDHAVKAAVNLLGRGMDSDEVINLVFAALEKSPQLDPNWPWRRHHVEKIVRSLEKQGGPRPAKAMPDNPEFIVPEDSDEGTDRLVQQGTVGQPGAVRSLREFLESREDEDTQAIIEGLIDAGRSHWLWAMGGSGKTLWTLDLAFSVISREEYYGREITNGPVLFVERDSTNQMEEYIETVLVAGGYDRDKILDNFFYADSDELHLKNMEGYRGMVALVDSSPQKPLLVILDAYKDFVSLAAGWADQTTYIKKFKDAMERRGIALLVIDHAVSKADFTDKEGNKRDPLETLYGGAIKQALFDTGLYWVGKLREGESKVYWAKLRTADRDPLLVSFDEERGFWVGVDSPGGQKAVATLTRKEQRLLSYLAENGPTKTTALTTALGIGDRQLRRMLANVLVPRGLVVRNPGGGRSKPSVLALGRRYTRPVEDPTFLVGE
jgi:hypothetical protein